MSADWSHIMTQSSGRWIKCNQSGKFNPFRFRFCSLSSVYVVMVVIQFVIYSKVLDSKTQNKKKNSHIQKETKTKSFCLVSCIVFVLLLVVSCLVMLCRVTFTPEVLHLAFRRSRISGGGNVKRPCYVIILFVVVLYCCVNSPWYPLCVCLLISSGPWIFTIENVRGFLSKG